MYGLELTFDDLLSGRRPASDLSPDTAYTGAAVPVLAGFKEAPPPSRTATWLDGEEAGLDIEARLSLIVRRGPPVRLELSGRRPPSLDQLVHPLGAYLGAAVAHWQGWTALHGAAVIIGGACVVMLGAPGAGKSTLCSALLARGHQVLSDDLSVLDGSSVFAGPASIDLRAEASTRLGVGVTLEEAIGRDRYRVTLGERPPVAPVTGFVELAWAPYLELRPVTPAERITVLSANAALPEAPVPPTSLLRLLGLPFASVQRPRDWDIMPSVVDRLEEWATGLTTGPAS